MDTLIIDRTALPVTVKPSELNGHATNGNTPADVRLTFGNLSVTLNDKKGKNEKCIIQDAWGQLRSGRLTGIMGPSGAGKSTLLNVLSGRRTRGVKGTVHVDGVPATEKVLRNRCSLVSQEVSLMGALTVSETFRVAADLKVGPQVSPSQRADLVLDIATMLGLEKCLKTYVKNLSGGEKKRVSIGVELVTKPNLMFFDEPTSGLDSVASFVVTSHLRALAIGGRAVAVVLHQPSSRLFHLLDDLILLGNGRVLYAGDAQSAPAFFSSAGFTCPPLYNFADFVIEVASKERQGDLENLASLVKSSTANQRVNGDCADEHCMDAVTENDVMLSPVVVLDGKGTKVFETRNPDFVRRKVPECFQLKTLLKRSVICTLRDIQLAWLRFGAHLFVSLLLGIMYKGIGNDAAKVHSNTACLFFFGLFLFFANAMPTVLTFPIEAAVVVREYSNNWYSIRSYYFSKIIGDLPFQILFTGSFVLIAYLMTEQPLDGNRLPMFLGITLLLVFVAQSYGMCVGAAFDAQMSIFLVPATSIPFVLFSGFFMQLAEIPEFLHWMSHISLFRYAFEGIIIDIYGYGRPRLSCSIDFCYWKYPSKLLEELSMEKADYITDVIGLATWLAILQILLIIVLVVRVRLSSC